jgi:CRISPR-associated endonuclease Cas2
MATNHYFICYDIASNRLRNKMAQLLLKLGCQRWQKSVFVARDFDKKEIENLQKKVCFVFGQKLAEGDSLLCIPSRTVGSLDDYVWIGTAEAVRGEKAGDPPATTDTDAWFA